MTPTYVDFAADSAQRAAMAAVRRHYAGKPATYAIQTYGCQMNEHDSEQLSGLLEAMGLTPAAAFQEADVMLFNTCCVREHAEVKVFGNVGALRRVKEARPDAVVCVCGCMMQQQEVAHKLQRQYPFVDLIFGTHAVRQFPELLAGALAGRRVLEVQDLTGDVVEGLPTRRKEGCLAYVNIMYGCDNFCSYCIVPYVRGRERSRRPQDILREIQGLVSEGVREVTLLGQNVNSYGRGLDVDFPTLLRRVAEVEGLARIRFMTSHPKDLSPRLIAAMAETPKVCRHLHLPVQAGSDRILAKMNRRYTREAYLSLVARLRQAVPGIAISTDLIVGFPGETEADFCDTLTLVEEARFDAAYTFKYSRRTGTVAADLPDQVPEAEKKQRLARLNALQDGITSAIQRSYEGTCQEVLVEGPSPRRKTQMCGRTSTGKMVNFPGGPELAGQLVDVDITQSKAHTLAGKRK